MKILSLLIQIEESEKLTAYSKKVLKDSSYIDTLKMKKKEFEKEKEVYKQRDEDIKIVKAKCKDLNCKINVLNKDIEEIEYKLYNEAGSDLKVINNLQEKLKISKNDVNILEDEILIIMDEEEKVSKEKESLRKKLIELRDNFKEFKENANIKIIEAKKNIEKGNKKIEKLEKSIPKNILKEFKDIKERKGTAVSTVEDGVCTACKIKVSSLTIDKINRKETIVYCDNCGRIVYYNEDEK